MKRIEVPSKEEVANAYYATLNVREACKIFNVTHKTFLKWMKGYGISRVSKNYTKHLRKPIRRFYDQGIYSIDEIAKSLLVSREVVSSSLKKMGLDTKKLDKYHVGFITTHNGYRMLRQPHHPFCDSKGYVKEHRLVMEDYLGRYLDEFEVVHHIDGNKLNNDILNLELCSLSSHTSFHHSK